MTMAPGASSYDTILPSKYHVTRIVMTRITPIVISIDYIVWNGMKKCNGQLTDKFFLRNYIM